ncbi:zinc-dependent alcohol dehydrogenase [Oceanobacillus sp. CF4.6]|uniref:zinc-dependent alcohol dehydrogenase n=1 Tax=Oceanobacillus sp. CF4.6 TaxID=3373080 RepID=UPI003EE60B07
MKSINVMEHQSHPAIIEKNFQPLFENSTKIKVLYGGICGTDIKLIEGRYPIQDELFPLTIGHEFVGEIVEAEANSNLFQVGDYVVGKPTLKSCMECIYCKTGRVNLCKDRLRLGINADGAFTEYISIPQENLIEVNFLHNISNGIWLEPISVVARGIHALNINPNLRIAIAGVGPIGFLTALMIKEFGSHITMIGLEQDRTNLVHLTELGIIDEFNIQVEDEEIFDIVIDCTGHENAINNLFLLAKPSATVLLLGTNKFSMNINLSLITYKELHVTGTIGANEEDWNYSVDFLKRNESTLSNFVHISPLEEAIESFKVKQPLKVKNAIKFY